MSQKKLCEITDVIPVRLFADRAKKLGPIRPTLMSEGTIFSILNGRPAPKHFYALDPNNRSRKILLTKENYYKTTEELFGTDDSESVNDEPTVTVPDIENDTETVTDTNTVDESTEVDVIDEPITETTEEITNIETIEEVTDIDSSESIEISNDVVSNSDTNNRYQNKKHKRR